MDRRGSSEERPQSSLPSSLIQHLYTGPQPRDSSTRTTLFEDEHLSTDHQQILPRLPPPDLILPPSRMQPTMLSLPPPAEPPFLSRSSRTYSSHPMAYSELPAPRRVSPPAGRLLARSPSVPEFIRFNAMPRQERPQSVSYPVLPPLQPPPAPSSLHYTYQREDRGQYSRPSSPPVKQEPSERYDLGSYRRPAYPDHPFAGSRRMAEQPGPSNYRSGYQSDSYGSYPRTYGEQASASSSRLPSDIGMFHEQTARSYERLPQPVASSSRLSPFFQEQAQSRADHGHTSFSTSYSMPESSSGHRSGTGEPSGGEYASSTPPQENDEDDSEWMEHPSKRRKKAESERPPNNRTGKKTAIACDFCRGRKLRCDGKKPKCYNCFSRDNQHCIYQPEQRRRGPGKRKKKAEQAKQEASEPAITSTSSRPLMVMRGEDRDLSMYGRQHRQQSPSSNSFRGIMGEGTGENPDPGGYEWQRQQQQQQHYREQYHHQHQRYAQHQQQQQQNEQQMHSSMSGMGGSGMMQMGSSASANPYPSLPPISLFEHSLEEFDVQDAPRGRSRVRRRRKQSSPSPPGPYEPR